MLTVTIACCVDCNYDDDISHDDDIGNGDDDGYNDDIGNGDDGVASSDDLTLQPWQLMQSLNLTAFRQVGDQCDIDSCF